MLSSPCGCAADASWHCQPSVTPARNSLVYSSHAGNQPLRSIDVSERHLLPPVARRGARAAGGGHGDGHLHIRTMNHSYDLLASGSEE
jgi:hypothetical protein